MNAGTGRRLSGIRMLGVLASRVLQLFLLIVIFATSLQAQAGAPVAPAPANPSDFVGQWQLVDEDSDDIVELWHGAVRDQMKREARRAPSASPMAMPANPGQHINLPVFLGTFKRLVFRSTPQYVVIEQQQFQQPESRKGDRKKFVAPDNISREVNLHPEATSISLRESALRPPTMFIGGWEKDALVIETTTDEGLRIEERWRVTTDDDKKVMHRQVRLRSSIWGEKTFEQQFERQQSS